MSALSLVFIHKPTFKFCFGPCFVSARFGRRIRYISSPPKTMSGLVKTQAWRDGQEQQEQEEQEEQEQGFKALEQDAFINSPPEFQNDNSIQAVANKLSKWVVATLFGTVLLLRHDGSALWALIGSVSNSALSVALKRLLNQQRPVSTLRSDPGMPSSHAQSISFISLFTVFSVMEWLGTNALSLFLSCLILAFGSYFTWLRVSQKLHTSSQVVVGALVGAAYSTLWYITWNSLVFESFASSLSVQFAVFSVAAASALGFAVYVLLNWFKR
ncbi:unnamed protein product [Cochlearia groenlandica]